MFLTFKYFTGIDCSSSEVAAWFEAKRQPSCYLDTLVLVVAELAVTAVCAA